MKRFLFIICVPLLLLSCKKTVNENNKQALLASVTVSLKDSLSKGDFERLDFSMCLLSNVDSANLRLLRVPFRGKSIKEEFVLLQVNDEYKIINGRIITISAAADNNINIGKPFNGNITISWLNGSTIIKSQISNGYITIFHPSLGSWRSLVVPYEGHVLGEVVVVSYISGNNSISYSVWANLMSMFSTTDNDSSGGGSYDNYYYSLNGNNYSGGGGGNYGGGSSEGGGTGNGASDPFAFEPVVDVDPIFIDPEQIENKDAIRIADYLKCFSTVPDAGSSCSIEILTDIPVDKDPNIFLNWNTGSPGHTFLQIRKSNGAQIVSQNLGFYPEEGWKTLLTTAPVKGKFVDNAFHEFNASLKRDISPAQLKDVLIKIENLSKFVKYDIDEYNCTDFALEVFNSVPFSKPLEIPKFNIPGGMAPNGTNTPQGLYQKLKSMRQAGEEYNNITIPGVKGFVSDSNGPCN
jgi:hypothetical protein